MIERLERLFIIYLLIELTVHSFRDWDFAFGFGNLLPVFLAAGAAVYVMWTEAKLASPKDDKPKAS